MITQQPRRQSGGRSLYGEPGRIEPNVGLADADGAACGLLQKVVDADGGEVDDLLARAAAEERLAASRTARSAQSTLRLRNSARPRI